LTDKEEMNHVRGACRRH